MGRTQAREVFSIANTECVGGPAHCGGMKMGGDKDESCTNKAGKERQVKGKDTKKRAVSCRPRPEEVRPNHYAPDSHSPFTQQNRNKLPGKQEMKSLRDEARRPGAFPASPSFLLWRIPSGNSEGDTHTYLHGPRFLFVILSRLLAIHLPSSVCSPLRCFLITFHSSFFLLSLSLSPLSV